MQTAENRTRYLGSFASLPSRERGLKFDRLFAYKLLAIPSLPSRERGLKLSDGAETKQRIRSLPSRERGLKYYEDGTIHEVEPVAPLAGAWIEIRKSDRERLQFAVAPLAGAWIEI